MMLLRNSLTRKQIYGKSKPANVFLSSGNCFPTSPRIGYTNWTKSKSYQSLLLKNTIIYFQHKKVISCNEIFCRWSRSSVEDLARSIPCKIHIVWIFLNLLGKGCPIIIMWPFVPLLHKIRMVDFKYSLISFDPFVTIKNLTKSWGELLSCLLLAPISD